MTDISDVSSLINKSPVNQHDQIHVITLQEGGEFGILLNIAQQSGKFDNFQCQFISWLHIN